MKDVGLRQSTPSGSASRTCKHVCPVHEIHREPRRCSEVMLLVQESKGGWRSEVLAPVDKQRVPLCRDYCRPGLLRRDRSRLQPATEETPGKSPAWQLRRSCSREAAPTPNLLTVRLSHCSRLQLGAKRSSCELCLSCSGRHSVVLPGRHSVVVSSSARKPHRFPPASSNHGTGTLVPQ